MMHFTDKQLEDIRQYAANFFTLPEIAIIADVPEDELRAGVADKSSEVYAAYMRGKYSTLAAIRAQEIELARAGSPVAIENAAAMLRDMNASEI
ncbi:MAG: hypothetical protein K2O24_00825 [Muribaculaceae bacterium]|nr:hypothetical protein [Muribaculaceae bacterium]